MFCSAQLAEYVAGEAELVSKNVYAERDQRARLILSGLS